MTGQVNPSKAHRPPDVSTSPTTEGPRAGSKLAQGTPVLAATPNAKVFQKSILLS